jgi:serine/threonine protein kinase
VQRRNAKPTWEVPDVITISASSGQLSRNVSTYRPGQAVAANADPDGTRDIRRRPRRGRETQLAWATSHPWLADHRKLGRYRLLGLLGAGGMGVVVEAEDEVLRRRVAVKLLKPDLAHQAWTRPRFLGEAEKMAAIDHPNVITVLDFGEQDGMPYLVMPRLEGETLAARLQREGALPVQEVVRIGRETAEGLAAAHAREVIHRDVKPANLWLAAPAGTVRLLDFGLAHRARDQRLTEEGCVAGTLAYLAPERLEGERGGTAGDLFSLGVVLYEMATGQRSYQDEDSWGLRPASELRPGLPVALDALILKLLARQPAQRPASAREVADVLGRMEMSPR